MTHEQIQSTLRQEYGRQRWLETLLAILPGTEVFATPQAVTVSVSDAPPAIQLARVRLGDRKQLAVLEVRVSDRIDLLRNRVGLRNLVARLIDQAEYHGVLAVFLGAERDYRFTFAARMAEFDADGNLVRHETTPRRYTYVLGPNESCRTAAERFANLAGKAHSATMEDVIEAFSVEKLNKEFFADFSEAFDCVKSEIMKRNRWVEQTARAEARTLLNRLLFLYFVQRKGWLNRQRDYLIRNFRRFAEDAPDKTTFLDSFLRPLFVKLSTEGVQAEIPGHDLPFLNGGLFSDEYGDEQHDETARRHHELRVSNGVFAHVFEKLLERYNFTIQEDSPTNYEVAIDPEMLGQIFEELILTSEESETAGRNKRHDTGSVYTRRPIVHYLCRDSLAAWLESQPPFVAKDNACSRIKTLLELDATEGVDEETRAKLDGCLSADEAAALHDLLFELRACDPGVGSGAFPMGLLHELLNLARLCATRAAGKDPVLGDRSWLYSTKKCIIERVIYGVDIQPQAVDICKLRLWLSLMVDYELSADPDNCEAKSFRKALREIEPLPNLDFKIRCANSLVDYIHGEPVELGRLSGETGAAVPLSRLNAAKRDFFNARTAAAKRKLRLDIYNALTDLARLEFTRARMDAAGLGMALDDEAAERVAELDKGLTEINFIAAQLRDARRMRAQEQEDALERIRARFDDPAKPTFIWQLDFAEVFHRAERNESGSLLPAESASDSSVAEARNGFDLLIGNPPYIRIQTLKQAARHYYKRRYRAAGRGSYDLYVVFVERSMELLNAAGQLAFILPHKFFNAQYGEPLRKLLSDGRHLRHVVHFGDQQIFPGATNYVCLLFLAKAGVPKCRFVRVDNLKHWLATLEGTGADVPAKAIGEAEWNFAVGKGAGLFENLLQMPLKLGDVAGEMFVGLQTSADTVYLFKDFKPAKRGFVEVVSKELGKSVVLEAGILKRVVRSGSIGRYHAETTAMVLFPYEVKNGEARLYTATEMGEKFPLAWSYLEDNQTILENREHGSFKDAQWYRFGRTQNLGMWEQPKLLVPYMITELSACLDTTDNFYFINVTTGGYGITTSGQHGSLAYLCALLNSPPLDFCFKRISTNFHGGYYAANKQFIERLPIPESTGAQRRTVEVLANFTLWLRRQPSVNEANREYPQDPLIASYSEQWVNALVYELFFPSELHDAGLHFFGLSDDVALPTADKLPEEADERMEWFRQRFKRLNEPGHPLRVALEKLRTLDLVRIIEGEA